MCCTATLKLTFMKRCDNCGWYNPDSMSVCGKCGEPLADIIEPEEPVQQSDEAGNYGFTPAHPLSETEPRPVPYETRKELSKTLRYVDPDAPLASGNEAADGSCPKCHYPVAGNPEVCPNCGASLRRNTRKDARSMQAPAAQQAQQRVSPGMMATVRDGVPAARAAVQPSQQGSFGKSTIRDVPGNRQGAPAYPAYPAAQAPEPVQGPQVTSNAETFRLVPLADTVTPVVYLREGDIVTIGGKRYRFVK